MDTHSSGDLFAVNQLMRKNGGLYRRALTIREKALGPKHAFVVETLVGLTKVCGQTGRAAEAQAFAARAKRIRARAAGEKAVDSGQ